MTTKIKTIETPDGDVLTLAHGKEYAINLQLGNLKKGQPLFARDWNNHGQPCDATVELNRHGVIQAFVYAPGARAGSDWDACRGRTVWFRVWPRVKAVDLRNLLESEEVMDLFETIHQGHYFEHDHRGEEHGRLTPEAEAARKKLMRRIDELDPNELRLRQEYGHRYLQERYGDE